MKVKDKDFCPYLSKEKIADKIEKLAKEINRDLADKNPLFVAILNGAIIFAADLYRNITIPSEFTSTRLKSYAGTKSTGVIKTILPLQEDVAGRTVVIIEDIVDSGTTIQRIVKQIKDLGATDVRTAVLLFKKEACKVKNLHLDYVGFKIPNKFVVGYGLDYDEQGRNLRDIWVLSEGSR